MSDDLIAWLRGVLDEDERIAEAAGRTCGCHGVVPRWTFSDDENDGRFVFDGSPHPIAAKRLTKRWNRCRLGRVRRLGDGRRSRVESTVQS